MATTATTADPVLVTPDVLARHDRPGPRYTSYPTAMEFSDQYGPREYRQSLDRASLQVDSALSLYAHLPFCSSRCSFCACHVVTAKHGSVAEAYLDRVIAEARLLADHLGGRNRLQQFHLGGGTPTYYSPEQLTRLHQGLLSDFELAPDAEVAIEVDPRVTTESHLRTLRELGFNRLSIGAQDFDPVVQELIGRDQTWAETVNLFGTARELGYQSINLDLIFGLPGQSQASFDRTLEQVLALRPDRLAVYSFAYLPKMRPNQKRIDQALLPDRDMKFDLLTRAMRAFVGDGYAQIGMDHFALPEDDLAKARSARTLSRNFMGYTTKRAPDVAALGTSGISDVQGSYAQNHKRLASYYETVDRGELPVERGVVLSDDDRLRRYVITELMCNGRVQFSDVEQRFGIGFNDYFATELHTMHEPEGAVGTGLATVAPDGVYATSLGEVFIRNVAMVFDAYTDLDGARVGRTFSRTI